jgi:hypothetical protein
MPLFSFANMHSRGGSDVKTRQQQQPRLHRVSRQLQPVRAKGGSESAMTTCLQRQRPRRKAMRIGAPHRHRRRQVFDLKTAVVYRWDHLAGSVHVYSLSAKDEPLISGRRCRFVWFLSRVPWLTNVQVLRTPGGPLLNFVFAPSSPKGGFVNMARMSWH